MRRRATKRTPFWGQLFCQLEPQDRLPQYEKSLAWCGDQSLDYGGCLAAGGKTSDIETREYPSRPAAITRGQSLADPARKHLQAGVPRLAEKRHSGSCPRTPECADLP